MRKPDPPKPPPRARPKTLRPIEFVWAFPGEPPYAEDARPMRNAPAIDQDGQIYLCTQGRLFALSAADDKPKILWDYVIGNHVPGRVVVAADGTLRAHSGDGCLHAVGPDGKQIFPPAFVGEPLGWAAPLVDARGHTFISGYDGGLIRVDSQGKVGSRRFFRSRRKLDSPGIIAMGVLFIGSEDGYVFALDLNDECGASMWNHAADLGYTGGFINTSPAMAPDGTLVVASRDELLVGFAPGGTTAWSAKLPGQMLASPVIDGQGQVYVAVSQAPRGQSPQGLLVCVDSNSHKLRWQYPARDAIESTPVVGDDGIVYFGDNSGMIHAVDSRGSAVWTARVEAAVRSAGTILAPERLAFGLDNDTLVVLKCSSKGLAAGGWPKIGRGLGQDGMATE